MGQMILNGIVSAGLIAPPAIAFTLLFSVLRFPNFAIGGFMTLGAFMAYAANISGLPLVPSAILGMAAVALAVWASDRIVFQPLRNRQAVTLLVVSIALTLILENIVRLIWGNDVRGYDLPLTRPIRFGEFRITIEQLWILLVAVGVAVTTHILLAHTRLGKAMRATADNGALAEVRGIDTRRIVAWTTLYAGALLGLSGVLAGLDLVIEPRVGWNLTIPIFAAAILGGIGSAYGAMIGAVLVGITEELTILVLPSTYKVGVGFIIIALLLLFRPHGLLGEPVIKK
ncbi:MAG: branched-chain amino acid ABC transporter permease [Geminicoccaceae bacterium]